MPFPVPNLSTLLHSGAVTPQLPRIPTAAKTYIDTVVGGNTSPITAKNFTPDELTAMRHLVTASNSPNFYYKPKAVVPGKPVEYEKVDVPPLPGVHYFDYQKVPEAEARPSVGLHSLKPPLGNVQTTLGQFTHSIDDNGVIHVADSYKFNPGQAEWWNGRSVLDKARAVMNDPYVALRAYGESVLPAGSPKARPVSIDLPPLSPP